MSLSAHVQVHEIQQQGFFALLEGFGGIISVMIVLSRIFSQHFGFDILVASLISMLYRVKVDIAKDSESDRNQQQGQDKFAQNHRGSENSSENPSFQK